MFDFYFFYNYLLLYKWFFNQFWNLCDRCTSKCNLNILYHVGMWLHKCETKLDRVGILKNSNMMWLKWLCFPITSTHWGPLPCPITPHVNASSPHPCVSIFNQYYYVKMRITSNDWTFYTTFSPSVCFKYFVYKKGI